MALSVPAGGHISYTEYGYAGYRGLRICDIPFDQNEVNVDIQALEHAIEKIKPKLLVIGASLILFPYPLKELREISRQS
jgi:glycine hydroxymethyltransferase